MRERGITGRSVSRFVRGGALAVGKDEVVIEEPLEIRVNGDDLAITMRTPGEDAHLAVGFLFAEGIIASIKDVASVAPCGRPGSDGYGNVIDVRAAAGVRLPIDRLDVSRRWAVASSACGVCGRRAVDDLIARVGRLGDGPPFSIALLAAGVDQLTSQQPRFLRTGGLHAACALSASGKLLAAAEDVGRHNAVDKVVGNLLYNRALPTEPGAYADNVPTILVVSGRASFEIVQKACAAKFIAVAAVSAPSSLAIDLAERANLTLAGFVRDGAANIYAGKNRIV
ncbi:MAG: formate dehydrogenase accessory sulfurtransferase FdhD [Deltaproteobacteria bacterium]|nr:formate dehydrogenase accessory sulfurtransferase FdhD [Deltaproteobacteria bacterium]